jgi:DNA repair exonuclease SbcCD ATPase subunit
MIICRALFRNVGPFLSDWEVELPEGVTAVVGEYEDASERSNRAGKSFLAVDGLLYALFGRFRGRTDDFVHRLARGREEGFVEYELESSEGRRFVVRRGRDRGGNPIRELDAIPIKDEGLTQVVRDEILGLSFEEFVLTNCFVQGEMHAFMTMTSAEKRRVVSPWFRTDRWIPRFELARERLNRARRRLSDLGRERDGLLGELERNREDFAKIPVIEFRLDDARKVCEDVLERRARVLADVELKVDRNRERARVEREVREAERVVAEERSEVEVAREEATRRLKRASTTLDDARGRAERVVDLEREAALRDELRETVAALRDELGGIRTARSADERARVELLERYRELTDERTGTCPVLREPCDRVTRDEEVVDEVRRQGLGLRRAIDRAERRIGELEWKLDQARSELSGADEAAETIAGLRAGVSVAQADHELELARRSVEDAERARRESKLGGTASMRALRGARRALEALPEEVGDDSSRRLAEISVEREDAERARDELERELAELRAVAATSSRSERRLAEIEVEEGAARADVERLSWAVYAFGATGIPSRELENAFGVAEDAMNSVLEDLVAPTRLRFSPNRELKEWEPACLGCGETFERGERTHVCPFCGLARRRRRRDELRLEVLDGENEASFELDSGGGKILLSLGVRLGLAQLPGATRRVRCESVIVDEPDGALDRPNRVALHRFLRDRLPVLGIRQALLITHADVRDEFESVVVVRRWEAEDRSGFWKE